MARFSMPFLEWVDHPDYGFYVAQYWDNEAQEMKSNGRLFLFDWQRRILSHVLQQDDKGRFPYATVVWSDIKKTGKSTLVAAITAWMIECGPPSSEAYICANSEAQSERIIFHDICFHFKKKGNARVLKEEVQIPDTDSVIRTLTKSYTSSAGGRHMISVWDELHGATSEDDRRRWDEMTPIPTIPHSLRLVSSYAGFFDESHLLYDLYLAGVDKDEDMNGRGTKVPGLEDLACYANGDLFIHWGHEPMMPWQTEDYYNKAILTERPAAYLRLHENRWVTSNEQFIPIEWWDDDASTHFPQGADIWLEHPYRNNPVYVGVDTGIKHDCTAVIGVTGDSSTGKVIILFHKIWTPVENDPLNLDVVEKYIFDQCNKYKVMEIACDPSQMLQTMTRLRSVGKNVFEFTQNGNAMVQASQCLYDLMHNHNLWGYPSEEIREHLMNVVAQHTSAGFRIVKDKTNYRLARKKIDLAVALAMACDRCVQTMGVDVQTPVRIESPFSHCTAWANKDASDQSWLPRELRTDIY